jgi:hypothetical protein
MLRNDEDKRGPNCKIKRHREINMHSGRGFFGCNILNPCLVNCQYEYQKSQRGVLGLGKMKHIRSKVGETQKDEICNTFLHRNLFS